jgi:hypothetical protein
VKVAKEFERNASLDGDLRAWVQSTSKELDVLRNGPLAVAVLNGDLVNSIRMEHQHIRMARNRVVAVHTGVVKLDLKSQGFERRLNKPGSRPFLEIRIH